MVAYPEAIHSGVNYQLGTETDQLDLDRVYHYLAQGRWFRLVSQQATLSLGRQIYYLGATWKRQQVEITFDADSRCFHFADDAGRSIASRPIKGMTKEMLMGDISDLSLLPVFQMSLPFSWEQQQNARLFETIS